MEDTHVWVIDADGSEPPRGRARHRQPPGRAGVDARTAARCYFTVQERGNVPPVSAAPSAGAQAGRRSSPSAAAVGAFDRPRTVDRLHASRARRDLAQLYVRRAGASSRALTDLNADGARGKRIAEVEVVHVRLQRQQVRGRGVSHEAGRPAPTTSKHPLIVNIHGGPHGQQGPAFNFKNQVYAARGWATLMVNYRGSTGYGQAFADAVFARSERQRSAGRALRRERGDAPLPVDRSRSARRRGHAATAAS